MKIAVFGASGKTGQVFIRLASAEGHIITAAVRNPDAFKALKKVRVMKCDVTNTKEVGKVLSAQDAVVSFLGHGKNSPPLLQTHAIEEIISVMSKRGVSRIISLTGSGVRFPGDSISLIDRLMNASINLIDHKRIVDGKLHVKELQKSRLDWTVLRVLKLTNGQLQPNELTLHGPAKILASRETVSEAVLELLNHKGFIRQAPIISSSRSR
jgi:putative NADH-flavin reductase